MHFHLPTYLPYYPEVEPENEINPEESNENEKGVYDEMEHPSLLSVMLVLGTAIGLVFLVTLYA